MFTLDQCPTWDWSPTCEFRVQETHKVLKLFGVNWSIIFGVLLTLLLYNTELKIGTNNLQIISDVVKISCHCKYFRTSDLISTQPRPSLLWSASCCVRQKSKLAILKSGLICPQPRPRHPLSCVWTVAGRTSDAARSKLLSVPAQIWDNQVNLCMNTK